MTDEIRSLIEAMPPPDDAAVASVRARAAQVLRPAGALARLDEVAVWLAGWQRTARPQVEAPAAVIFVADHGVAAEGVSAYPAEVTEAMFRALRAGVATASAMARTLGATLKVVDVGVGRPTGNLAREPALSRTRFDECFAAGRRAVSDLKTDLLVLGEMGIAQHHLRRGGVRGAVWRAGRGVGGPGHRSRRRRVRPEGGRGGGGPQPHRGGLRGPGGA